MSSLDTKWRILASCPNSQYIGTLVGSNVDVSRRTQRCVGSVFLDYLYLSSNADIVCERVKNLDLFSIRVKELLSL